MNDSTLASLEIMPPSVQNMVNNSVSVNNSGDEQSESSDDDNETLNAPRFAVKISELQSRSLIEKGKWLAIIFLSSDSIWSEARNVYKY